MSVQLIRGDTWTRIWEYEGSLSLAGATARLHVRNSSGSLVMSASTTDGRLVVNGNQIELTMPYTVTGAVAPGTYDFDLEVTFSNGYRVTFEQGKLKVIEDYSHD